MKFNYFDKYYTHEHKALVLKELREFVEDNNNNIDDFFEQLAKNIAFTDIMHDFYYSNGMDTKHEVMGKYSNDLRHLQWNIADEIKGMKKDLNINKLKDFLDREIEKTEVELKNSK